MVDNRASSIREIAEILQKGRKIERNKLDELLRTLAVQQDLDFQEVAQGVASEIDRAKEMAQGVAPERKPAKRKQPQLWVLVSVLGSAVLLLLIVVGVVWVLSSRTTGTTLTTPTVPPSPSPERTRSVPIAMVLQLRVDPQEIMADGSSKATITAEVKDQNGNKVPDGAEVHLSVSPPGAGTLAPALAWTSNGQVQATFTAGREAGQATIQAQAGQAKGDASLTLTEPPRPDLELDCKAQPDPVGRDQEVSFTFLLKNKGEGEAQDVDLRAKLPPASIFVTASDGGTWQGEEIQWPIGKLTASPNPLERRLGVRIPADWAEGNLTIDYWVACSNCPDAEPKSCQVTIAKISVAEIVAKPLELPADGQAQATITATVSWPDGVPAPEGTAVEFLMDPDGKEWGQLDPFSTTVHGDSGQAVTTFTAGIMTGTVTVRARVEGSEKSIAITLQEPVREKYLNKQAHLYSDELESTKLIIYQLPTKTPVRVLGQTKTNAKGEEFIRAAVEIWVPTGVLTSTATGWQIGTDIKKESVIIGKSPDNPPVKGNPQLQSGAAGIPVEILDDSRQDYRLIRIEGWILKSSIAE